MNNEGQKYEVILAVKQWCEEHGFKRLIPDIYCKDVNDSIVRIMIYRRNISFTVIGTEQKIYLNDTPVKDFLRACTAKLVALSLE